MNWPLVPQQFVTGLLNGGTIGLIALGIVLIYKSSEVFNFAHGHLVMFGAVPDLVVQRWRGRGGRRTD